MQLSKISFELKYHPVTPDRWNDFEHLFGERGACGGCWCMLWRLKTKEFDSLKGSGNKDKMKQLILNRQIPGIILYDSNKPIGWCSIAPRDDFVYFSTSRIYTPIDDQPVWSITCLFILKEYRGSKLSTKLIQYATEYALQNNAKIVEGYPFDLSGQKLPPPFVWTGLYSSFLNAGFEEVARRSAKKPIMRFYK